MIRSIPNPAGVGCRCRTSSGILPAERLRPRILSGTPVSTRSRLALHWDRNKRDAVSLIVSISLGLPATLPYGGVARLSFHGVYPSGGRFSSQTGKVRYNLTLKTGRRYSSVLVLKARPRGASNPYLVTRPPSISNRWLPTTSVLDSRILERHSSTQLAIG
jgi:hypothetical protein